MSKPMPSNERLYALTNSADGNAVAVFVRQESGNLIPLTPPTPPDGVGPVTSEGVIRPLPAFPTGGLGAGAPLISQSSLALSQDKEFLFAVNPGSNEVTSFLITPTGLQFANKVSSGGLQPVSVATFGNLVYVVNAVNNIVGSVGLDGSGTGQIAGFSVGLNGVLTPLEGSIRELRSAVSAPAQIGFNPDGTLLIITELAAGRITVFQVEEDGRPGTMVENKSAGLAPYGFAFTAHGHLIVAEAGTVVVPDSTVSSYAVSPTGELSVITAALPTQQRAACWIANTPDGRYSYSANPGSSSLTGFSVSGSGELELLSSDGRDGLPGDFSLPLDVVISADGQYLDVLTQGTQTITTFRIAEDGCLTLLAGVGGLPPVTIGLAIG